MWSARLPLPELALIILTQMTDFPLSPFPSQFVAPTPLLPTQWVPVEQLRTPKRTTPNPHPHKPNGFCAVCAFPPKLSCPFPSPPSCAFFGAPRVGSRTGFVKPPTTPVTGFVTVPTVSPTGLSPFSTAPPSGSATKERRPGGVER